MERRGPDSPAIQDAVRRHQLTTPAQVIVVSTSTEEGLRAYLSIAAVGAMWGLINILLLGASWLMQRKDRHNAQEGT